MKILVAKNGSQLGPFSESDIRAKLASGEFSPMDLAWKEGMSAWSALSQILADSAPLQGPPPSSLYAPPEQSSSPAPYSPPVSTPKTSILSLNRMTPNKQQYLTAMRENTAYPTYRGTIGLIALLGYILAGVYALAALVFAFRAMAESFFAGLIVLILGMVIAAIIFLGARFWKEAALILADIGDSITEANSRQQ